MNTLTSDIVIVGGGIAGLWILHCLRQRGYQALLLESDTLGSGQTRCAQGIIHSGLKYALAGRLNDSATAIADMPAYWQACLQGKGTVDLSSAKRLSPCQYLWTEQGIRARLTALLASQAMKSHCQRVFVDEYPSVFKDPHFKGDVYRLDEPVLDVVTVLAALSNPYRQAILQARCEPDTLTQDSSAGRVTLQATQQNKNYCIQAKTLILAAGNDNESFLKNLLGAPAMQQRSLHMVTARMPGDQACYAHCVDGHINPKVTITTYPEKEHSVWYLGGGLAETGIARTEAEQIDYAKALMRRLFSWLPWGEADWRAFRVDRAEVFNHGKRPAQPFVEALGSVIVTWPTKMAFAPLVAERVQKLVMHLGIAPSSKGLSVCDAIPHAQLASPPWQGHAV